MAITVDFKFIPSPSTSNQPSRPTMFPTLPPELVIRIISLAAPVPAFEFLQDDWADGVEYTTLKSLCLTSRAFSEIATPLLYRHLVLPAAESGQALLATLASPNWQTGRMAGKADEWVKEITLGRQVEFGDEDESGFVEEVLSLLLGSKIERVAAVGVRVNLKILARLPALAYLKLHQTVIQHEAPTNASAAPTLLNVTHLRLSNNSYVASTEPQAPPSAASVFLIELVRLDTRFTKDFVHSVRANKRNIHYFAPCGGLYQLEHVSLDEWFPWWMGVIAHQSIAPSLTKLRTLVCGAGWLRQDVTPALLLERLPRPLAILSVTKGLCDDAFVEHLRLMFTSGRMSVSELKRLNLLDFDCEDERRRLGLVVTAAQERGVKVEWV